jgi:hypothetical protein
MKISTMLKRRHKGCEIFTALGGEIPRGVSRPRGIYVTSLFTWDLEKVIKSIQFYSDRFPRSEIHVGGIAASLLPDHVTAATGIVPHVGLLQEAEACPPDYSLSFDRKLDASITFASRGCPRHCRFCCVSTHEPDFFARDDWEKDVSPDLPRIIFWDNNWLASPNFASDCGRIRKIGKCVDFNQGLDARLYDQGKAKELGTIKLTPIRFAFDDVAFESHILKAITLARRYTNAEIRVYVLYNFLDTPEGFYQRINLLNRKRVLAFPMEYRKPIPSMTKFPGRHWDVALLRALKLTLIFYYRRGMITEGRDSFLSIYGKTPKEFVSRLYDIYEYDKKLKRPKSRLS